MGFRAYTAPGRRHGLIAAGFLACALVFGGGGTPTAAAEIIVQLAFAAAVVLWFAWAREEDPASATGWPRPLVWLAGACVALPLLQLVSLPPVVWQGLPGREGVQASLALIDQDASWRPLSVAPHATVASLLAIVPGVGLMLAATRLDLEARRLLIAVVAGAALAAALLGALQIASGNHGGFQFYNLSHRGWLTGFFANRNAAVDGLLIGSLAVTALFVHRSRAQPAAGSALALFVMVQAALLLAAVLTGSRAGIALIPVSLGVSYAMLRRTQQRRKLRPIFIGAAALVAVAVVLPALSGANARLAGVAERFDVTGDVRSELWRDSAAAMAAYWPAGSGLGSFTRVFPAFERLETLDQTYANRAHNDYLELLIEAGILAPALLLGAAAVLAMRARRGLTAGGEARLQALFALGTLAIIALHSVVDYPLRTMALAALAGVAAAFLAPPGKSGEWVEGAGSEA